MGGFLVWLLPFTVSCFLIGPDGKQTVSEDTFRTTMILVGSFTSSTCTYLCEPKTMRGGIEMALVWLFINWLLDLIVLVPLFAMEQGSLSVESYNAALPRWFVRVGLCYVGFVSMCVVSGACAERAANTAKQLH